MQEAREEHQSVPFYFHGTLSTRGISSRNVSGINLHAADTSELHSNEEEKILEQSYEDDHESLDDDEDSEFLSLISPSPRGVTSSGGFTTTTTTPNQKRRPLHPFSITTNWENDDNTTFVRLPSVHLPAIGGSFRLRGNRRHRHDHGICWCCYCCCPEDKCCGFSGYFIPCCIKSFVLLLLFLGIFYYQQAVLQSSSMVDSSISTSSNKTIPTSPPLVVQDDDDFVSLTLSANIHGDYSTVKSVHDVMIMAANVHTMCFDTSLHDSNGNNSKNKKKTNIKKKPSRANGDCPCAVGQNDDSINTRTTPVPVTLPNWQETHELNIQLAVGNKSNDFSNSGPNVVFYGDSITERWHGTQLGNTTTADIQETGNIFDKLFRIDENSSDYNDIRGLALGIAGDQTPNLLWRLENGELPATLQPSIFVVLIGTNDLSKDWCSPENVIIGIIRIVELLLKERPAASVLLHGLLPRTDDKDGYLNIQTTKTSSSGGESWGNYFFNDGSATKEYHPSFWPDIQVINEELEEYALNRKSVKYTYTNVFFTDMNVTRIDMDLMPDGLHPSSKGYEVWGKELGRELQDLLMDGF